MIRMFKGWILVSLGRGNRIELYNLRLKNFDDPLNTTSERINPHAVNGELEMLTSRPLVDNVGGLSVPLNFHPFLEFKLDKSVFVYSLERTQLKRR